MKTLEQLKELESKCLDGRDFNRLAKFIPYNHDKGFRYGAERRIQ
jgi:hypothetical protein